MENCNFAAMQVEKTSALQFDKTTVSYAETGFFGKLILDYLKGDPFLTPFYHRTARLDAFGEQMEEKAKSYGHRSVLVSALKRQYAAAKLPLKNVLPLENEESFTITTGHQVCLFTGPLYFLYKIVSIINTCKSLKEQYADKEFVPVFWMATEDHDFAEANHFITPSGKVEWESGQGGAVGRMDTVGMEALLDSFKDQFGVGYGAAELTKLFSDSYIKHKNIADATRYLVHHLFGKYGVVIIDGDDPELKAVMTPYFEKDIFENSAFEAVEQSSAALGAQYKTQVTPREINIFYLGDELRERIVKNGDGQFDVLNTSISFSEAELKAALISNPADFSPNVILRPLYQEVILPNLAYIGGGGELAYWFQLKGMFDCMDVPFPVLMLRNSVGVLSRENKESMDQNGLTIQDLFTDALTLERKILATDNTVDLSLSKEMAAVQDLFDALANRLGEMDATLIESTKSGMAKTSRTITNLEKKLERAARRKHQDAIAKFEKLQASFVVNGGLQERVYNYSFLYLLVGDGLIDGLIDSLDPFDANFSVLTES